MEESLLISSLIVLVQLFDSYLRWLIFSRELSREQNFKIWSKIFAWSAFATGIYFLIFSQKGIGALEYKLSLMLGEMPLLGIFIYCVGGNIFRHVFAINMVALWIFILHSISAFIVALFFLYGKSDVEIIFLHIEIVLGIFLILLPIERKIFRKIWLPKDFFSIRPQSIYVAFLPLVILMAHFIRLADDILIHSWAERLSRIYLPFMFIFFYQYILVTTKMFYKTKRFKKLQRQMKQKLLEIRNYNKFLTETQNNIRAMKHDLRHAYRLIYALLSSGEIKKAQEFIITQKLVLESAVVRPFCKSDLINASLEAFLTRAEEFGINVTPKINIPNDFSTNEDDFALLIANLMKFTIEFGEKSAVNPKKISMIISHREEKFILEIRNNFSEKIKFDSWGLPIGFETDYIKKFLKTYDATTNLETIGDITKFSIYWRDFKIL